MVWKMRKLKAYLRPSVTTFCRKFFGTHARKMEKSRSQQQFPVSSIQLYLVRININLTYSRTMSSKNPAKGTCSRARQKNFKELCGSFYPYTSDSEQETKVVSYAGVTFSFNSRMMAETSWFGWPTEAQRPTSSGQRTPKSVSTKDLCHQYSEMSPASGNIYERTRITILRDGLA